MPNLSGVAVDQNGLRNRLPFRTPNKYRFATAKTGISTSISDRISKIHVLLALPHNSSVFDLLSVIDSNLLDLNYVAMIKNVNIWGIIRKEAAKSIYQLNLVDLSHLTECCMLSVQVTISSNRIKPI